MNFLIKFSLLLLLKHSTSYIVTDELILHINDGPILGRYMTSLSGKAIRAFMSIPFAAPPVGELRFKPPQKVNPWSEILPTQTETVKCMQFNPFARRELLQNYPIEGQEDCLYLNVYAPEKRDDGKKLPVLVWIHGGGWIRGESGRSFYGPEFLLDHDIIFVAGNYRVGPLGFLSTEDEHCPGNNGFKDQAFLLKWVQENIEHFGGDKNSVTIWGESAGGASVHYQMISPMSRGLFQRAISHSGTLYNGWSDPVREGDARKAAIQFASHLNCVSLNNDSQEIVNCLRSRSAENLTRAVVNTYYWDYDPLVAFPPVIESFHSNEQPFIAERNFQNFSNEIPWLVGMNTEEGLLKVGAILDDLEFLRELTSRWEEVLPYSQYYDHLNEQERGEVTRKITDFYFGNDTSPAKLDNPEALINVWTDGWFIGIIEALKQRFEFSSLKNTFVYLFTHKGSASFSASTEYLGTAHVDDLLPFFPLHENVFYSSIPTRHDQELQRVMTSMWINFVKDGHPMPIYNEQVPIWPTAYEFPIKYMQIGNENGKSMELFKIKEDLFKERSGFWMELREKYNLNTWVNNEKSSVDGKALKQALCASLLFLKLIV